MAVSDLLIIIQGIWTTMVSHSAIEGTRETFKLRCTRRWISRTIKYRGSLDLFTDEREIRFQSKLINMQFVIPRAAVHVPLQFFPPRPLFFDALRERRLKIHMARIFGWSRDANRSDVYLKRIYRRRLESRCSEKNNIWSCFLGVFCL